MKQTIKILKNSEDIVLLPHVRMDGDTLGSCIALCRALRVLGKKAYVEADEPAQKKFFFMLDDDFFAPEDFVARTCVAIDCGSFDMLGSRQEKYRGKIDLAIDHHISHVEFGKHTLLVPTAAATSEIIYDIILGLGLNIDKQMARDIYVGIISDTGCFKFSNTTPKTFKIAAHLTEIYGSFHKISFNLFDLKTIDQIKLETKVLETLEFNRDGRIASIVIDNEMGKSVEDTDMFPQIPRRIEGVEVGVTYKAQKDNEWKVSLRGSEAIDVSEVCFLFGGGGHKRAAGATITGELDKVKAKVLKAINGALDESDQNGRNTKHL